MGDVEDTNWWFIGKRILVAKQLEQLNCKTDLMVDIGAGTGSNARDLSSYGKVIAMDISMSALRYAADKGHSYLCCGDSVSLPFRDDVFDVVTALDIVEHVTDDAGVLNELYRSLKPNGNLIVSVPAFQFMWGKHDELLNHKRRYKKLEIENKMKTAGFEIKFSSYSNMFIFFPVLLIRLLYKWFPKLEPQEPDTGSIPSSFNKILIYIYRLEVKMLKMMKLPVGLSVLLVGFKKV